MPLAQAQEVKLQSPFAEYPLVAPHIFVYERELFAAYKGASVARLNVPDSQERSRIGIVSLAPKIRAYVDQIDNKVHGRSFFEFTELQTGALLGKIDLGMITTPAELLFTGQGTVYLHHVPTWVCFGSATRKFVMSGKRLVETPQAMVLINTDANVFGNIKIFSSLESSANVVATLQDGAKVSVLGIAPDSATSDSSRDQSLPILLIKSPLGLAGWYVPGRSESGRAGISITQCN
jgi:hypothetical protein